MNSRSNKGELPKIWPVLMADYERIKDTPDHLYGMLFEYKVLLWEVKTYLVLFITSKYCCDLYFNLLSHLVENAYAPYFSRLVTVSGKL